MHLLSVPTVSSRYHNKIKRTSYLGKLPTLSLEILQCNNDTKFMPINFMKVTKKYWSRFGTIKTENIIAISII